MATIAELLAAAGSAKIPNTSLSRGVVAPRQQQRPQMAPARTSAPVQGLQGSLLSQLPDVAPVAPAPTQQGGGGILSALGKTLGNIGSGAAKALTYGSSGVTGLVGETLDVIGEPLGKGIEGALAPIGLASRTDWENDNPYDGDFSWGDIGQNVKDGTGFGERIVEPVMGPDGTNRNKWVKRAAGLAGDVAADPLTYVTLGSTQVAGKTNRAALATKAIEKGLGEEVASKAGKGAAFLNADERAILGIEQAGVRFGGVRVAGTEGIANAVGRTTGSVRGALTNNRPWQTISRQGTPEGLEAARQVLSTGRAIPGMSISTAAGLTMRDETIRTVGRTLKAQADTQIKPVFDKLGEAERIALTHATEGGAETALTPIMKDLRDYAVREGVDMGDLNNYVPHSWSDKGRELLTGKKLREGDKLIDITAPSGVTLERVLNGGMKEIDGRMVDLGDGSIQAINDGLTRAFKETGVTKWLEDDSGKLLSSYINRIASDVGEVAAWNRIMKARIGVANPLEDVSDEIVDLVATRTANKEMAKELRKYLDVQKASFKAEQEVAISRAKELQAGIVDAFGARLSEYGELGDVIASKLGSAKAGVRSLDGQAKELGKAVVAIREGAEKAVAAAEREFFQIEEKLRVAQVRLATTKDPSVQLEVDALIRAWQGAEQAVKHGKVELDKIGSVTRELAEAVDKSRRLAEYANDPDKVAQLSDEMRPAMEAVQEKAAVSKQRLIEQTADAQGNALARQADLSSSVDRMTKEIADLAPAQAAELKQFDQALAVKKAAVADVEDWGRNARASMKNLRKLIGEAKTTGIVKANVEGVVDEFDAIIKAAGDDADLAALVPLMDAYASQVVKATAAEGQVQAREAVIQAAKRTAKKASKNPDKNYHNVFTRELQKGWEELPIPQAQRVAISDEVAGHLTKLITAHDSGDLWKTFDKATQFFKTYATMTPGFHVRNAMSGVFMNFSDGVTAANHTEAFGAWRLFEKNPMEYLAKVKVDDPQLYDAFQAALGSGAGGSFSVEEIGQLGGRSWGAISNPVTRASRTAGQYVEGPMRLAMAINTTRAGGTSFDALNRVSRIHFDYAQLSKMDKNMKRIIPFWTFMSRNLPLQMQQMMMRPRLYAAAASMQTELGEDIEGVAMPTWLQNKGAFLTGGSGEGATAWAPDLPHLNMLEDFQNLSPTNPERLLSQLNPLAVAPIESLANKDFYYGNELGSGTDRVMNTVNSLLPPVATAQRIGGLGKYDGQAGEKQLGFLGIPRYTLSKEEQEAARYSQMIEALKKLQG